LRSELVAADAVVNHHQSAGANTSRGRVEAS
jgi:hypothetical protein